MEKTSSKPSITISGKTYTMRKITIGDWLDISQYEDEKTLLSVPVRIQKELDIMSSIYSIPLEVIKTMDMEETWPKYLETIDYLVDIWASKLPKAPLKEGEVVEEQAKG